LFLQIRGDYERMEAERGAVPAHALKKTTIHGGDDMDEASRRFESATIPGRKGVVKVPSLRGRFRKEERINHPQDFRRVMKLGKRLQSKNFILFIQENDAGFHRLGLVVKKEIGPATYRNRMKRYLREFFRLHKDQILGSSDMVIMAKKGCALNRYREAEKELGGFFAI
jgi:ribonuclease P protein component